MQGESKECDGASTQGVEGKLLLQVVEFFSERFPRTDLPLKLVLGLSGGADSMALWHLLLDVHAHHRPIELTCIHVDHGWREESGREGEILQDRCAARGIKLKIFSIKEQNPQGNLEAFCRKQRLEIFQRVVVETSAEALILAHHAGDRVEGMLKRIFEGSELAQLRSLAPDTQVGTLRILRPLLAFQKFHLMRWLNARQIEYFTDSTNFDARTWRGFVRTSLLPQVQSALGKELLEPLSRLADYAQELNEYLDKWWEGNQEAHIQRGFLGTWIALPRRCPPLFLRHLIRNFAESFGSSVPISSARRIDAAVRAGRRNLRVEFGGLTVVVEGKDVFFLPKRQMQQMPSEIATLRIDRPGSYSIGRWRVIARRTWSGESALYPQQKTILGWPQVWKGEFVGITLSDLCSLTLPRYGIRFAHHEQTLFSWWGKCAVPAFLRQEVPVLLGDESVTQQWLCKDMAPKSSPLHRVKSAATGWHLRFVAL